MVTDLINTAISPQIEETADISNEKAYTVKRDNPEERKRTLIIFFTLFTLSFPLFFGKILGPGGSKKIIILIPKSN